MPQNSLIFQSTSDPQSAIDLVSICVSKRLQRNNGEYQRVGEILWSVEASPGYDTALTQLYYSNIKMYTQHSDSVKVLMPENLQMYANITAHR